MVTVAVRVTRRVAPLRPLPSRPALFAPPGQMCEGCAEAPYPTCAGCGAPAETATLADERGEHAIAWCGRCIFELLRIRGERLVSMALLARGGKIATWCEPLAFVPLRESERAVADAPPRDLLTGEPIMVACIG